MAVAWSKSLPHTCYEVGHCWNPSCTGAVFSLWWSAFKYALKVNGTLYLLAAILRQRKKDYFVKGFVPETIRSAIFLSANAGLFLGSVCLFRHVLGALYFPSCGFLPGFSSSFIAILLERKSRRPMLALYVLNLAIDTAFRMFVSRGMISLLPHGEVWLFSVVISVYIYLYKKNGLEENITKLLSYFVGKAELPPGVSRQSETRSQSADPHDPGTQVGKTVEHTLRKKLRTEGLVSYMPSNIKAFVALWKQSPKHTLCRHQFGCLAASVESAVRFFVVGYAVQAAMKLVRALSSIFSNPRALLDALRHHDNVRLGLFLGSLTGLLKMCHCLLRWITNKDSPIHGLISGFVAGWSMIWYKSSNIAMWLTSKLAEILYFKGVEKGLVPKLKNGDVLVYALSTAFCLHAAVYEPHNIRPAYWKFLLSITGQRYAGLNRQVLNAFGTNASKLYPDYWPDYDARFLKNL